MWMYLNGTTSLSSGHCVHLIIRLSIISHQDMASVGTVITKLGRTIGVVLAESTPDWIRITSAIDRNFLNQAVTLMQQAIDNDKLFKDEDLDKMETISI
jgi:hypothetical protein